MLELECARREDQSRLRAASVFWFVIPVGLCRIAEHEVVLLR